MLCEWLGTGFYLWQDSPWRAREWAEGRLGVDAAMVVVRVDLDGCLELLNPKWQAELHDADFEFVLERFLEDRPVPGNTDTDTMPATATINFYCDRVGSEGRAVRSVRAVEKTAAHLGALGGTLADLGSDVLAVSALPEFDARPTFIGWVGGEETADERDQLAALDVPGLAVVLLSTASAHGPPSSPKITVTPSSSSERRSTRSAS